ncbi:hypothetical protein [Burkholderia anthina]|uniref:hypothetical protein n=1 Tax=Burkholderia anthina TaxID=179879 RepID=UPI00292FD254|nr:hypothetical protein [Burkholderia anthina]WJN72224.1 hypothetical protein OH687_39505 [Burkholderia anthina]
MAQIALQVLPNDTLSSTLHGAKTIAFTPLKRNPQISEAVINEYQYEAISDALQGLPHKIDFEGHGISYEALNGANW